MISILLATYNWPQALKLCLESLATQTDHHFEIIIADDGSTESTKQIIGAFQSTHSLSITHLWQEDQGFRKTKILNQAIEAAKGDYLIFLDGDCLVQPDFVARHRELAQKGFLVTGSRVLLNEKLTQELLATSRWDFKLFISKLLEYRLNGGINKYWPLKIKLGNGSWRDYKKFVWRRIKGCNMACWKTDAQAIDGFDETMTGWGHEDADFVFRLQRHHIKRKSGSWSTEVLHLFHQIHDQSNAAENARRVREKILAKAM
ncbi:glycosyltransferase family 2 protein [Polynucleobacter sp. AP-Sanab-80-C2]|uniref:glycosyltransferase family 2 protein n=1 Tax=unclassified Polynucleobacter TaxID=2640945 RepID=UPI001BFEE7B9|nr:MULTISPECIES: glycosyltransferase family 2 protein [unclassified Polynucleobacter]MEA9598910.1 glycosyltransferase family 2 protein [Polynucleobacter sp. AP-Sanab-80-C2]QWE07204.1 glycosyltransferase family 2 protein [Polynucleobacter sp. JS-JIR-5-A7]